MSQPTSGEGNPGRTGCRSGEVEGGTPERNIQFGLWFNDGSVVLVAARTAFRVHAPLLSRHSPVFEELFAVPHTSEGGHLNGCSVFHLSDTAEDLDHFLQLIYDAPCLLPRFNPFREVAKPSFARLSAYIRLGYKYEISALVNDAVRFLEAYFTTNFDVWEKVRQGKRDHTPFTFSENPCADAIDTVNLARMTGTFSLLPVALYQCSQLDPFDLMEGVKRSEADTQVFSLSNADIALCLRAKQTLLKASANVSAISLLLTQCSEPEFSGTCTDQVYGISTSGVLRLDQDLTTDPLGYVPLTDGLGLPLERLAGPVELCETCKTGVAFRARSARQRIWSELPTYFELLTLDPEIRMVINDPLVREMEDQGDQLGEV